MADLAAEDPFTGLALPLAAGEATLSALPATARATVAPFAAHREATSGSLRALTGAGLPPPGRAGGPLAWFALDLDPARFPAGSAARSLLRHVPLLLVAREAGLDLLVPRSYARTAVHELATAMRTVAARRAIA